MQKQHDSAFSRALNRVLFDTDYTAQELAGVARCSARHIYAVRNGEANMDLKKAGVLARYLSERGEYRLSRAFLHDSLEIVTTAQAAADGRIDDDITALVRASAACAEAHQRGVDPDEMNLLMANLRRTVEGVGAELTLSAARRAA